MCKKEKEMEKSDEGQVVLLIYGIQEIQTQDGWVTCNIPEPSLCFTLWMFFLKQILVSSYGFV